MLPLEGREYNLEGKSVFATGRGKRLVLNGPWYDHYFDLLESRGIRELHVTSAVRSLDFLSRIPQLEGFGIFGVEIVSLRPIESLAGLRQLRVSLSIVHEPLDFSKLVQLDTCQMEGGWRGCRGVFRCPWLRHLSFRDYKRRDTSDFSSMSNLESLRIGNGPVADLSGLRGLRKLKSPGLYYLTKLPSLEGVEALQNLRELHVETCRKVPSVDPIAGLVKLRKLNLSNMGELESIRSLTNLKDLRAFFFDQSTNVLDGDLSVLLELPQLALIAAYDRKHYRPRAEAIEVELVRRHGVVRYRDIEIESGG